VARFDPAARTGFVMETIGMARRELGDTPLIGFAGAPFTVATYAIEGKTSKSFAETKSFFYRHPDEARRLLATIGEATRDYLVAQVKAGAQAVQLFDSWVGVLSAEDFETFVLPPTAALCAALRETGVPVIYFGNGAAAILDRVARVGADVYGLDWRLPIDEARARLGGAPAVQGNLDPAVLLGPIAEIERRARDVVRRGGKRGHIFNLGHGITPDVPLEAVTALVAAVRGA
jgi:uroporphyrinogen decarboxylase